VVTAGGMVPPGRGNARLARKGALDPGGRLLVARRWSKRTIQEVVLEMLAQGPSGDPAATGRVSPPWVAETHVSYVFFAGDRAYKLKKPVRTDVLDFSSVEARRLACEAEVALNRRLAADVYLGVAAVTGPDGTVCDHLVVMRRLPAERRLSRLIARAGPEPVEQVVEIAGTLAGFHAGAARSRDIDRAGSPERVLANWAANTAALRAEAMVDQQTVEHVDRLARRYVTGRAALFAERIADGRIVDGHGDLQAEDVFCLDDGPRILDCLEFDPSLRYGDTLADVAFLAMDLERLGRVDLGALLLAAYRRAAGDDWPDSLAHHWIAYRAQVRAKVACLRSRQGNGRAAADAQALLALAARHLEAAIPRLVLVGGLPGTGKSTLASGVAELRSWPVLGSDVTRKQLAGLDPLAPAPASYGAGLYRAAATATTYAALLDRAGQLLRHGRSVVIDASWTSRCWRDAAADLADATGAHLVPLQCHTSSGRSLGRIAARAAAGRHPSDATEDVAAIMALVADEWGDATVIDTTGPPHASLAAALTAIGGARPD
jgi:aminoglycoside phosphotransferase family enzyme/predicted kinase